MTSSVLQNKIPFFILYSDIDLFTSKDFGSLYFVHNHSPYKTKLKSKSLKGIFLGDSRTKKDYKCFCPSISRYILSAHITFFESIPRVFTSPSASEDDYDYLFYRKTLLNSGGSTSKNVTD